MPVMQKFDNPDTLRLKVEDAPPPKVEVGDEVYFYENCRKQNGLLATVAAVSQMGTAEHRTQGYTVDLFVQTPTGPKTKKGVRHIDNPRAKDPRLQGWGAWDFRPPSPVIRSLKESIERLDKEILELKQQLATVKSMATRNNGK
jgi:hypothetical protein